VSSILPSANPGSNESDVEGSLSSSQRDRIRGKKQNAGLSSDTGTNTIATNATLTPEFVKAYIDQAKANADVVMQSTQAGNGITLSNQVWGTTSDPKIVYIKGEPDTSSAFTALDLTNTEGAGILIVEDGDLKIRGNFRWKGVVIVTGQYTGLGFMDSTGVKEIYGAVIANETQYDGTSYKEGYVVGDAIVKYSCEAIGNPALIRKLTSITAWKELPPTDAL
jgi:hypothetical protein